MFELKTPLLKVRKASSRKKYIGFIKAITNSRADGSLMGKVSWQNVNPTKYHNLSDFPRINFPRMLRTFGLSDFGEYSGPIYPDLVKVI